MPTDLVYISITPVAVTTGNCELCLASDVVLAAAVVVRHTRGGAVQFAACERCARAMRRVEAATGGPARFGDGTVRVRRAQGEPELIRELGETVEFGRAAYVPRVYGQLRADGTWTGWLEFADPATGALLRTGQETTQSSREHLAYWASGLESTYVEGAFRRARPALAA